jgi:tetratricopeptide (TPR) repeat protein
MIKAAAVGNPLLMEKEELDARLAQLERKHKNYLSSQRAYAHTARSKAQDHGIYTAAAAEAEQALARRINTRGDAFAITLADRRITARPAADTALHALVAGLPGSVHGRHVGAIGGFTIVASSTSDRDPAKRFVTLALDGVPQAEVVVAADGMEQGRRVSIVTRLENRLYDIERTLRSLQQAAISARQEADRAQARIGAPFADQTQLDTARARLTEVNALLRAETRDQIPNAEPAPPPSGTPTAPQLAGPAAQPPADSVVQPSAHPAIPPPLVLPPTTSVDHEPASIRLGHGITSTDRVLQAALIIAEQHGFVSRHDATEHDTVATADLVHDVLTGSDDHVVALRADVEAVLTRGIVRRASIARHWARNLTGTSDYHQKLRVLAADDTLHPRDLATLVSAIGGYLRHERDQAIATAAVGSQWQSSEGDTVTVPLARILSTQSRRTDYGISHTLRMIDAAGNLYSWTTNTAPEVSNGDLVIVTGRVKAHQVWQQRRETQLTRVSITVTEPAGTAAAVTAPQPLDPGGTESDRSTPPLADTISLDGWLHEQSASVRQAPDHLLYWLREQIAEAANDPRAKRAARLAHTDTFNDVFDRNLTEAISAGWHEHGLEDVELFRQYADDESLAADLRAAAGLSAYLALRARFEPGGDLEPSVPVDRQKILIRAIEDHAAQYAPPHNPISGLDPARYVAEAHVPGGATPTEWDFIAYYLHTHPELLQRPPRPLAQLDERDRRERAHARDEANRLSRKARHAYNNGKYTMALDLIDQAAGLDPTDRHWDDIRHQIRQAQRACIASATPMQPAESASIIRQHSTGRTDEGSDVVVAVQDQHPSSVARLAFPNSPDAAALGRSSPEDSLVVPIARPMVTKADPPGRR